jgi:hypothetical protein
VKEEAEDERQEGKKSKEKRKGRKRTTGGVCFSKIVVDLGCHVISWVKGQSPAHPEINA